MKVLLDRPGLAWALCLFGGVGLAASETIRRALLHVLERESGTLVGASVSLLGFAIAGLAIVISVHDRGLVKALVDAGGEIWEQLIQVFMNSARVFGASAVFFFVAASVSYGALPDLAQAGLVAAFGTMVFAMAVQVTKIVHILERVARFEPT